MVAQEWRTISLRAAFSGLRGFPWWLAIASNNAHPLLEVSAAGVRCRVLRLRERAFAEIEEIDVRTAFRTVNLRLLFHNSAFVFSGNVGTVDAAKLVLPLFASHVQLSERAARLLD
jgi:hypothetical protein